MVLFENTWQVCVENNRTCFMPEIYFATIHTYLLPNFAFATKNFAFHPACTTFEHALFKT